jgi:peroxin-12
MQFISGGFSTDQNDYLRPSWIEMFAQHQMMETLRPAVQYILDVLSTRYSSLARLSRFNDECFALGLLLLERHFLRYYNASFAENFYSLHRVKGYGANGSVRQTRGSRALALFCLVAVPYVKAKLDRAHAEWRRRTFDAFGERVEAPASDGRRVHGGVSWLSKLRRWAPTVYPWLSASYEGAVFAYSLAYLYGRTRYFTPLLHLQRVEVLRLTGEQLKEQSAQSAARRGRDLASLPAGFRFAARTMHSFFDYLKYILPLTIFVIKFAEWYYREDQESSQLLLPTPPPPPPPTLEPHSSSIDDLPLDPELCPLCRHPRANAALAGSSGLLFCYACIFRFIEEHHRCPITAIPLDISQIRKVYLDS